MPSSWEAGGAAMISRKPFQKPLNHVLGVASDVAGPVLRLAARAWTGGQATPPSRWRRGLIIGHIRVGDVLYRTCSLEFLKRGLPDCDWYYLAAPDSGTILAGNPWLKGILPLCSSSGSLNLLEGGAGQLRELGFDVALCTNAETYWLDLLVALRARVPNRAGYVYRGLGGLVTHALPCAYPSSRPVYFRDFVARLTGQAPDWPLIPRIFPAPEDEIAALSVWQKFNLDPAAPILACFMTTRESSKVWPLDCYQRALALIKERRPEVQIVVAGAKGDAAILTRFAARCAFACTVLAGELSLKGLYCFLKRCRAVVAPDSGPRHIANAAGVPVAFIRNLACSKVETGSYCSTEIDLSPDVEFIPPEKQEQYLRLVKAEKVAEVLSGLCCSPGRSTGHSASNLRG
jgi:ADP-heptose:LPS heptosyltransferase